jgi:hypothetical protein
LTNPNSLHCHGVFFLSSISGAFYKTKTPLSLTDL